MSRDLSTRLMSGFLSLSLHAAAGFALLWAWDTGVPVRDLSGGDKGNVLIVELIPLERADGVAQRESAQDGDAREMLDEPRPLVASGEAGDAKPQPRAAGPESHAARASAEAQGDARDLADLPSADVLAYRRRLEAHLARYRIYPVAAQDAGREGVVMLHFVMSHEGRVLQAWVGESSGASDIDREAVAAVMRAQPLPAFPQGWPGQLSVILPVTFRLG
ncbi:energy transducer TonB family protein [Sphingopyxis indica]|uniref:Protein TonB n=1 Tax=Sphingopyxis indica TaxID=436663 RepID=A0A239LGH4_9SPHN|nr:energy transducer TonB [Sphingopyxis indica]SNT29726.1 protein TonB [Sphingopyxis indica]